VRREVVVGCWDLGLGISRPLRFALGPLSFLIILHFSFLSFVIFHSLSVLGFPSFYIFHFFHLSFFIRCPSLVFRHFWDLEVGIFFGD
jgi:hypothetical protein